MYKLPLCYVSLENNQPEVFLAPSCPLTTIFHHVILFLPSCGACAQLKISMNIFAVMFKNKEELETQILSIIEENPSCAFCSLDEQLYTGRFKLQHATARSILAVPTLARAHCVVPTLPKTFLRLTTPETEMIAGQ